jgi:hypothetical protein
MVRMRRRKAKAFLLQIDKIPGGILSFLLTFLLMVNHPR